MNEVYISELVDGLETVLDARKALREAIENVPDYTAQYRPEHFYEEEQKALNIAYNNLYDMLNGYIDQRIEERCRK